MRDAIELAVDRAAAAPLTILGELVHNDVVLEDLRARGVVIAPDPAQAATRTVMITAHGASQRTLANAGLAGREIVDATCPLVHKAHRAIRTLVSDGFHPVIIGQRAHVEVRGLTGDLEAFDVVLTESDVQALGDHPRIGVAAQTTQPIDRVRHLVGLIRRRFPESDVRFVDTVCQPTKLRQDAAVELAQRCDVVIVIGGANSNNTRELVQTCARHCSRVHHVHGASDLRAEWFDADDTVGITAGTSTPDGLIDRIERSIRTLALERDERAVGARTPA